jgi:hypothetical protein
MRKHLKELGLGAFKPELSPGGMHSSPIGKMGPTADADSTYSRRSQFHAYDFNVDFLYDEDDEEIIQESKLTLVQQVTRLLFNIFFGIEDDVSEIAGALMLPPRLATNVVQLIFANRKARQLIAKPEKNKKDIKALEKVRHKIGTDVTDILNAIIMVFPIPGLDSIIEIMVTQMSNEVSAFAAEKIIGMLENVHPTTRKLLYVGTLPMGGPVIYNSLLLIEEIDEFINRHNNMGLPDNDTPTQPQPPSITECRVYKNKKYRLVETLKNLDEFPNYSDKFSMKMNKINSRSRQSVEKLNSLDEDNLDEFSSAGAVAGVQVPLGHTSKGKRETVSQRKRRQKFNRSRSFPYKKK